MTTPVTWSRIEPHARTTDYAVGEAAELADPLWLLARQWQLGELAASDGGSPVAVDVRPQWSMLTRARIGGAVRDIEGPIEAMVEGEALLGPGTGAWTVRARAGRDLEQRLEQAGFGDLARRLREQLAPLRGAPAADDDATAARYAMLLAGRVTDGAAVLSLLATGPQVITATVPVDEADAVLATLGAWQADVTVRWGAPGTDGPSLAWSREGLEYDFYIAAPPLARPGAGPTVLSAQGYDGTGVDWYSFDADRGLDPGPAAPGPEPTALTLLPTALTYPGAPADRFWELEDGTVYLGGTPAGPTDLAKLVAIDFAIVSSPDWLLVPLEVPVGSVAALDYVVVRDTFGVATVVADAARPRNDGLGAPPFSIAGLRGPGGAMFDDRLVVLPSPVAATRSRPRERVLLARDELANLAWGIELVIAGSTGRGVDRRADPAELALEEPTLADWYQWVWRLATPVRSTWFPYVAGPLTARRQLLRARFYDTVTGQQHVPAGQLLAALDRVDEERVTRDGIEVRVLDQLTRWHDGATYAWRGREVRPGRGEASSGLRYDTITPRR